jgi:hypothetical protein
MPDQLVMLETVVIGADSHSSLITVAFASSYLSAAVHSAPWDGSTSAQKSKAVVSASRLLDAMAWNVDAEVSPSPLPIRNAAAELANELLRNATVGAGSNVKRIDDKGLGIEFWRPTPVGQLPSVVARLIAPYLAAASSGTGTAVNGGAENEPEISDACDDFEVTGGL